MSRERVEEYAGRSADPKFVDWLIKVDNICEERCGLSLLDLEDMQTWDSFSAGETPELFIIEEVAKLLDQNYGSEYGDLLRQ